MDVTPLVIAPKDFQAFDLIANCVRTTDECMHLGLAILPNGTMNKQGFVPLHFTGRFDEEKHPIYEQDIVEIAIDTGFGSVVKQVGVMRWSRDAGTYAITYVSTMPGQYQSRIVKKLGTMFTDSNLLKQPE